MQIIISSCWVETVAATTLPCRQKGSMYAMAWRLRYLPTTRLAKHNTAKYPNRMPKRFFQNGIETKNNGSVVAVHQLSLDEPPVPTPPIECQLPKTILLSTAHSLATSMPLSYLYWPVWMIIRHHLQTKSKEGAAVPCTEGKKRSLRT